MATADAPSSGRERVQVVVRCRPMSHRELVARRRSCVKVFTRQHRIEVRGPGRRGPIDTGVRVFEFDRVCDSKCSQEQLYQEVAHPVVESVMHGYNGTVLAYGQTASGKTYTMEGFDDQPGMVTT
ncbi:kinesin-II 85 kDa subunit-like [Selaginella moellendorffii]|uniref:kinesin-II 85 kDa subunit-like n=1 Tax=Selaginella moellendorffii TaxID=88036 RepID=UPI000D1CB235|nr:kinesin-II 85 kDa subunit-like [Selaginella moellendorffii]|eukprot:XP_024542999.1 kinesin-II 85 kDa subunit-like [Selaginella moellendorffii]